MGPDQEFGVGWCAADSGIMLVTGPPLAVGDCGGRDTAVHGVLRTGPECNTGPVAKPLLSVAMTTYQGEKYLAEQLDSILRQSRLPDEIVIGDDASIDSTWEILVRFARSAKVPVRLLRSRQNVGLNRNIETVMRACRGEVLILADQDDVWATDKVAVVEEAFTGSSYLSVGSDA